MDQLRVIAIGICEGIWIKGLLKDLELLLILTVEVLCDNKIAINIVFNLIQHDQMKHVENDRHSV